MQAERRRRAGSAAGERRPRQAVHAVGGGHAGGGGAPRRPRRPQHRRRRLQRVGPRRTSAGARLLSCLTRSHPVGQQPSALLVPSCSACGMISSVSLRLNWKYGRDATYRTRWKRAQSCYFAPQRLDSATHLKMTTGNYEASQLWSVVLFSPALLIRQSRIACAALCRWPVGIWPTCETALPLWATHLLPAPMAHMNPTQNTIADSLVWQLTSATAILRCFGTGFSLLHVAAHYLNGFSI